MNELKNILLRYSFELAECSESEHFGDFTKLYKLNDLEIRLVQSKSILSMDIRKDRDEWFDMGVVKNMILKDENLNRTTTPEELELFLNSRMEIVIRLFDTINYPISRLKIKELETTRAKQMFGLNYPKNKE